MGILNEPIQLIYYMVFVTRYKRKIFDDKETATLLKSTLLDIQDKGILEIISLEVEDCYVSLVCNCEPSKSPNQIVSIFKRASYQALLEKMPHLNSLWARNVILRTSPVTKNEIDDFLLTVKRRG